jgi:hypothetical protein
MTAEHTLDPIAAHSVRGGHLAPVTCVVCGCRLEAIGSDDVPSWFHYGRMGGRDARGDLVPCLDAPHDSEGNAALAA